MFLNPNFFFQYEVDGLMHNFMDFLWTILWTTCGQFQVSFMDNFMDFLWIISVTIFMQFQEQFQGSFRCILGIFLPWNCFTNITKYLPDWTRKRVYRLSFSAQWFCGRENLVDNFMDNFVNNFLDNLVNNLMHNFMHFL